MARCGYTRSRHDPQVRQTAACVFAIGRRLARRRIAKTQAADRRVALSTRNGAFRQAIPTQTEPRRAQPLIGAEDWPGETGLDRRLMTAVPVAAPCDVEQITVEAAELAARYVALLKQFSKYDGVEPVARATHISLPIARWRRIPS